MGFHNRLLSTVDDRTFAKLMAKSEVQISLKSMVETGTGKYLPPNSKSEDVMLQIASFLYKELPVRMAHRISELEALPFGMAEMPSILATRKLYKTSLSEMLDFTVPTTYAEEAEFKRDLEKIYQRHNEVLIMTARALFEWKEAGKMEEAIQEARGRVQSKAEKGPKGRFASNEPGIGEELVDFPELHEVLDHFLTSRIGIRVLIGQYLALHPEPTAKLLQFRYLQNTESHHGLGGMSSFTEPDSNAQLEDADVGLICMRTKPAEIAAAAAADATDIFERQLTDLVAPEVKIIGNTECVSARICIVSA
jgi:pyruvate dehydrogenase kinase 2/3/4